MINWARTEYLEFIVIVDKKIISQICVLLDGKWFCAQQIKMYKKIKLERINDMD